MRESLIITRVCFCCSFCCSQGAANLSIKNAIFNTLQVRCKNHTRLKLNKRFQLGKVSFFFFFLEHCLSLFCICKHRTERNKFIWHFSQIESTKLTLHAFKYDWYWQSLIVYIQAAHEIQLFKGTGQIGLNEGSTFPHLMTMFPSWLN